MGRFSNQGTLGEVGRAPVHDEQSLATARERYNRALGATTEIAAKANAGPGQEFDTAQAVFVFGEEATEVLIQAGWVAPGAKADRAFANHGQKVSTYVSIAKALGHSAHIGVLQANFGRDESASGPEGDWRDVNLDVNGDRIVDEEDLRSAKLRQVTR